MSECRRILLKLSGEALAGGKGVGIDSAIVRSMANDIARVHALGVDVGVVIGAGNIVRGISASSQGIRRETGDQMGMLGTVINCLALQDALAAAGVKSALLSGVEIGFCERFSQRRLDEALAERRVVLFAGGTGNPYFTTDTAAALRALEFGADVLVKATKVDGIYDSDPMKNPAAKRFDRLTLAEAVAKDLKVMDAAALALCRDNKMPILVCKMDEGNLEKAVGGEGVGTLVEPGE
ncbi:MAG: UMP kinase [Fibrobacterales bacterium]|nr:UMP kinase [Fibrobacterales bacterium]MBP5188106.1 UMP kinase [Fibrobacterales bacterium]MBP5350626.1 UMP kinase [Fibrobacterales bacterium]